MCALVSSSASAPISKTAIFPPTDTVPAAAPARRKFFVVLADVAVTETSPPALTRVFGPPPIQAWALLCTTRAFSVTPTPTVPPPPTPPITSIVLMRFTAATSTFWLAEV